MKHVLRQFVLLLTVVILLPNCSEASDLLPSETPIQDAVDHYIQAQHTADGIAPASVASEHTILRRTTLDLAGRIPTRAEYDWYFQQPGNERRSKLVERLIQLPDFDYHQRNELDALLLYNRPYDNEFRSYLLSAIQQDRTWDRIFRDLILAEEKEGDEKGAVQYVLSRVREVDDLTNDTAVLFFGVNISCAKCHDHPLVDDWRQDHYYGMQSFFSRTYKTKKNTIGEKLFDEVKYKTTAGEDKIASYMFLTGTVVDDQTPMYSDEERKSLEEKVRDAERKDDVEIPVPDFSPRRQLVEVALNDNSDNFFSRNIANRIWARLMGVGLVDPPDQMHSGNPASHPELLDWLARDLREHNYELTRLLRGIALSDAYARSSEWPSGDDAPATQSFAVAYVKPLTPWQIAASLHVAARNPDKWPATDNAEEWAKTREALENQANGWVREFEQPGENFQVAVDEALFFSNNDRIRNDILREGGDRLIGQLKEIDSAELVISKLWVAVLNRPPADHEQQAALEWLEREGDRTHNIRELAWALIAGPEFRFNH